VKHSVLARRIARLEARDRPRQLPQLAFVIHEDDAPSSVEGFSTASGVTVRREPSEPLSGAMARAFRHPSAGRLLFAVYAKRVEPTCTAQLPALAVKALAEYDAFALAGVGRRASPAELKAMGLPLRGAEMADGGAYLNL
jgi:hypothetical protein